MEIILASASPRRKELLEQIGMEFQIIPAVGEEKITKNRPEEVVMELSQQKAKEVAAKSSKEAFVIGADTVVAYQGHILGKPKDEEDACRMLQELSGHTHEVYTGVTFIDNQDKSVHTFYEKTSVSMYEISDAELEAYIATKEPMDKAGAYGIQGIGAKFIRSIAGDYCNVVGLPVGRVWQEIKGKHIEM